MANCDNGGLSKWFDQSQHNEEIVSEACFTAFDKNGDCLLDLREFDVMCRSLFHDNNGTVYNLEPKQLDEIFAAFDKNKDGFIDKTEFAFCWDKWIKTILRPVTAFIIVDVQNDFITGTLSLSQCPAQQDGAEVVDPINKLLKTVKFDRVIYSLDWHPNNHISFVENLPLRKLHAMTKISASKAKTFDTVIFEGPPIMSQKLWPRHCVQDTWGAELHKDLTVVEGAIKVYKGMDPEVDSYSAFWDNNKSSETKLNSHLQQINTTDVYVGGLANDICVAATARHALESGYRTILVDDCSRGTDVDDIEEKKRTFIANYGVVVQSSQVKGMIEGHDRRADLGYKLAVELKKSSQS